MKNIAIIKNGLVENLIAVSEQDRSDTRQYWIDRGYQCVDDALCNPGDAWDGTSFTHDSPEDADTWLIGIGAFYDRFGAQKIPILASDDAVVQALVKDAQVRKYIDLKRSDLPQMLDIIISKGFAIDKAAILETPATAKELP